jgi:hypothetical protein
VVSGVVVVVTGGTGSRIVGGCDVVVVEGATVVVVVWAGGVVDVGDDVIVEPSVRTVDCVELRPLVFLVVTANVRGVTVVVVVTVVAVAVAGGDRGTVGGVVVVASLLPWVAGVGVANARTA